MDRGELNVDLTVYVVVVQWSRGFDKEAMEGYLTIRTRLITLSFCYISRNGKD